MKKQLMASIKAPNYTLLKNGVHVVTESLPGIRSASVGLYLDTGSRDEQPQHNGLAHLYEHMVFKGTATYNPLQIVQRFEAAGGQVNAYTSKEQTCLHAKVVDSEVEGSLAMLLEMALASQFDEAELKKEKEVIVEEIHSVHDNPEEQVYELFTHAMFGKHSLGRPIAGTDQSVRGISRDTLLAHQTKAHETLPFLISAVGSIDHKRMIKITEAAFAKSAKTKAISTKAAVKRKPLKRDCPKPTAKHLIETRKVQQASLILGGPGYGWDNPKRLALLLMNTVLGDGMSSRLFQSVREDKGLVYSIYSSPEFLMGTGMFTIGLATEPKDIPAALKAISTEIRRLKREGLSQQDLDGAKANLRGSVLLSLESTNTRMGNLARQYLNGKGFESVDSVLKRVEKVNRRDITGVIADVFDKKKWASAVVGPMKKLEMAKLLDF